MRVTFLLAFLGVAAAWGQDLSTRAWDLERQGEGARAREMLQKAAEASPNDTAVLRAWADFLDRHRDPARREVLSKLLARVDGAEKQAVARRLALLDLSAGDRKSAEQHLAAFREAGGSGLELSAPKTAPAIPQGTIDIPGPLRSFSRMAALSPDLRPEDVMGALARNVVTNGYQASNSAEALEQTEYLKLVVRYLSQARELERLAGAEKTIKIEACESAATGELLRVLGYRMRGGCGSDVVLETLNASRAFLTIDSGFPLAELEQALRTNRPFTLDYQPSKIPVIFGPEYWQTTKDKQSGDFIDFFLGDPSVCRLYLGLSKLNPETAKGLSEGIPVARIRAYAHVLDFFGGMFQIRNGKAVAPGGDRAEKIWVELAGAPLSPGAAFFERLISRDDGWMASYFDALLRINGPLLDYLTEPDRLKRFYLAIRGRVTSPGPARPVFRSNTDMMLLTTRMRLDGNGKPYVPGNLEVWKNLFVNHPHGKYDGKLTKAAGGWKDPDDLIEALFGLCRKAVENEPLKMYMAISDIERFRTQPLAPATVDRLAREWRQLGSQYPLFSEAASLSDATIIAFLDTAEAIAKVRNPELRADAAGTFQALVALSQILVRQKSIPDQEADRTIASIIGLFGKIQNDRDVFDGGREGVKILLAATKSPSGVSSQDRMLDLLAGTATPVEGDARQQKIEEMMRVFESQRLVPLNTLFEVSDNLEAVTRGEKLNTQLVARLAARFTEMQLPRSAMTSAEKNSLAFGYWTEKHIDAQRKMNLRRSIERAVNDPEKLKELRGELTPFLRDTLVGFTYVHYAPPGAQVLHTNPLFVRSHDFIGIQGANQTWKATEVFGTGWPANAGGRLVGSLATLPYALAEAEQNFLIPTREQALIWGDLVPQLILSAVIPRWWSVTPDQLHWVGAHMSLGETLLAESALNAERRQQTLATLELYAPPARLKKIEWLLESGDVVAALENVMPSEMYQMAANAVKTGYDGAAAGEIRRLAQAAPDRLNYQTVSRVFGTPKPTLANSFQPELLHLRTFPTLMGYSSRILAESWESNLLYYAALADEVQLAPAQLNVLIPTWTQLTVERIFATHLEDWPALLRSLRLVGDEVRERARRQGAAAGAGDN